MNPIRYSGGRDKEDIKKKLVIMESRIVFTPDELAYLDKFNWNAAIIEAQQQREILNIYNRVLGLNQVMTQCTPCWQGILFNLKKLYDEFK